MPHVRQRTAIAASALLVGSLIGSTLGTEAAASDNPQDHPSQQVACQVVDEPLSRIPHGNGDGVVTDDEVGPGGWRYNGAGRSFVTFAHDWDGAEYDVVAGRSRTGGNSGIINDYPAVLGSFQPPQSDQLVFKGRRGEIVLSGSEGQFELPGKDGGQIRINVHDADGDGTFEGCAKSPLTKNFGFVKPEGGDFVQREYFKAYAETDGDGNVDFYEWTEVSTFNNSDPDSN